MKELTEHLEKKAPDMDRYFEMGAQDALAGYTAKDLTALNLHMARYLWRLQREADGLVGHPDLLTWPGHNVKLDKATLPSYGLTLQHYVQRINKRLIVNACPNAGDCTKVCVLDNGMGRFDKVQLARRVKTKFLAEQPRSFAYLLGYDLARAARRHENEGGILFRPNVNSDVAWERVLPSMTDGSYLNNVMLYGYTKRPEVLDTDGWLGARYRVAYSWNESADFNAVARFLGYGGSVAVVTDRKKGDPNLFHGWDSPLITRKVMDADLTDEWIFQEGVIGDLSAKGRARSLIGKSGFVVTTGAA